MEFPPFIKNPDRIIENSHQKIFVFNETGKNIDYKTVESFGKEWNTFHGFTDKEIIDLGDSYFDIVTNEMLHTGHQVLEVGCGSGRFIKYLAGRAGFITGIDPSEAVFAASELIGKNPRVRLVRTSASALPFDDESFDFVYSIGVLHHIPDTAGAMKDCVRKLKKGGYFLTYIYYNLDNRGFFFRGIFKIVQGLRNIISRLPAGLKKFTCDLMAVFVYMPFVLFCRLLKLAGVKESIRNKVPLQFYESRSFYVIKNDSLDRFGTPLEQRFSRTAIKKMMEGAGLTDIIFSDQMPYWHAVGKKI